MKEKRIAYLFVLIAALLWGSTPAVGKLLIKDLNNLQVMLFIFFIASITLFFMVLFQKKLPSIKKLKTKDFFTFFYMGFLGIFMYNLLFYGALMFSSAQSAFIANYTWPVWIVIFSILILKEKFEYKKLIGVLLGFFGVYFAVTKGNLTSFSILQDKGIILAILGAIFYGLFSILGKKHNYDRFISMMFYYISAFILTLITILLFSHFPTINGLQLLGLLWLGVFTAGIAFVSWFLALKYGDTSKMSNLIFLTPFISFVYIYILTGEGILLSSFIGLVILVAGILIQSKK